MHVASEMKFLSTGKLNLNNTEPERCIDLFKLKKNIYISVCQMKWEKSCNQT